jgi:hypothetical protein
MMNLLGIGVTGEKDIGAIGSGSCTRITSLSSYDVVYKEAFYDH